MKIYFITAISSPSKPDWISRLEESGDFTTLSGKKFSNEEIIKKAADAEILIVSPTGVNGITKDLLVGLKKLKFITMPTAGYNWVDIETAKSLGIQISNVQGANSESVAEHIWAMILDLAKRVTEFSKDAKELGAFNFQEYEGKEVFGKTIGIIGVGNIGKRVARIAHGFNMKVLGINKSGKPVKGVKLVPLKTLLKESDVIAICVPFNEETKNLISKKEIALMKKGVIIVNCANEKIVDKKEIIKAVKTGKLFGYGGDLEIMKPIPPNDDFLKFPNIIVHPHNAFNTEDSTRKVWDMVVENTKSFLAGKPKNLIT